MPGFPETRLPNLPVTTIFSEECLGPMTRYSIGIAATSGAWQTNNHAIFYPWRVESPLTIVKGIVLNGATASGNIDVGVYDHEFTKVVSGGGTAQSGTSVIQEFDITDTLIMPGNYWMAIVLSSTSGTVFRISPGSDEVALSGLPILGMDTAYPLPSTATPVKSALTSPGLYVFGFSTEATI